MAGRPRGLLVARELRRASRRWQGHLLRVVVVAPILVALAAALSQSEVDASAPGRLADTGAFLFALIGALLMITAVVVAPLMIARAVQAERDEGTLDLLALTGIAPVQVLLGSTSAQALGLLLLLLGTAPLVALVPTLGGVGLRQVVSLLVAVPVLAAVMSAVAARAALAGRSLAEAVVATAGFALLCGFLLPLRLIYLCDRLDPTAGGDDYIPLSSPLFSLAADDWTALLANLPLLTIAAWVAATTAWAFRRGVATGWDPEAPSWPGPRGAWMAHALLVLATWGTLELGYATMVGYEPAAWVPEPTVLLAMSWVATALAGVLYVRAIAWMLPHLARPRQGWGVRVPVFGNPVLWRELFTTAQGALSRGTWVIVGGWVLLSTLMLFVSEADEVIVAFTVGLGVFGAHGTSVLLLAGSLADERRRGTLPLLLSTTLPPRALLTGKILAAMARALPLGLLALGLYGLVTREALEPALEFPTSVDPDSGSPGWLTLPPHLWWLYPPAMLAWLLAAWTALLSGVAWISLRLRSRVVALTLSVILGLGLPVAAMVAGLALDNLGEDRGAPVAFDVAAALIFPPHEPIFRASVHRFGEVVFATLGLGTAAAVLFRAARRALRRRGSD